VEKRGEPLLWRNAILVFMVTYALVALLYQGVGRPFWDEHFGNERIALCGGQTWISLPGIVPRALPQDNYMPARAATVRAGEDIHIQVGQGGHLEGTGSNGHLALPQEYLLWVPPDYPYSWLQLDITGPGANCQQRILLSVEPKSLYALKRLFNLFFGIPLISITTIALSLLALWAQERGRQEAERIQKQQERCTQIRQSLDHLRETDVRQPLSRYIGLWREERDNALKECLRNWWQSFWYALSEAERWDALDNLRERIIQSWPTNGEALSGNSTPPPFPPTEVQEALKEYLPEQQVPSWPPQPPHSENAPEWLKFFGLRPAFLRWLSQSLQRHKGKGDGKDNGKGDSDDGVREIIESWVKTYGIAGYFLAQQVPQQTLTSGQKEKDILTPATPPAQPPLSPWPIQTVSSRPPFTFALKNTQKSSETYLPSPFGPEKAERDPRLKPSGPEGSGPGQGLFWEEHAIWKEIRDDGHSWITTSPGSGVSAFILSGRYRYRYWGTTEPGFSLHLFLEGLPSPERLQQVLTHILAQEIVRNLAEDPTWMLNAPALWRAGICAFLLQQYGALAVLTQTLEQATPATKGHQLLRPLLQNEFRRWASSSPPDSPAEVFAFVTNSMLYYGSRRFHHPGRLAVRIFVEIPPSSQAPQWSEVIREHLFAWNWGAVKVFAPPTVPPIEGLSQQPLEWSKQDLTKMIAHRLKVAAEQFSQPAFVRQEIQRRVLHQETEQLLSDQSLAEHIVQHAVEQRNPLTPQALIAWGNRQLSRS